MDKKSFTTGLDVIKEVFQYFFGIMLDSIKEHGPKAYLFLVPFWIAIILVVVMIVRIFI